MRYWMMLVICGLGIGALGMEYVAHRKSAAVQSALSVDYCALAEYEEECDMTVPADMEKELHDCKVKSITEATRILAGIPAECKERK